MSLSTVNSKVNSSSSVVSDDIYTSSPMILDHPEVNTSSVNSSPVDANHKHSGVNTDGASESLDSSIAASIFAIRKTITILSSKAAQIATELALAGNASDSQFDDLRRQRDLILQDLKSTSAMLEVMLKDPSSNSTFSSSLSTSSGSSYAHSAVSNIVPRDLPKFQWTATHSTNHPGNIYPDLPTALMFFEDSLNLYKLDFDHNWYRLIPTSLSVDQRLWLKEYMESKNNVVPTWALFKRDFIARFGVSPSDDKSACASELMTIKMSNTETIDTFNDRFNNLRRRSAIFDMSVLYTAYTDGLPAVLIDRLDCFLLTLTPAEKGNVDIVMPKAKELYYKLYKAKKLVFHDSLVSGTQSGKRSSEPTRSLDSKRSKYAPSSAISSSAFKKNGSVPEKHCTYHKVNTHNTVDCRGYASFLEKGNNAAPMKGTCFKCGEEGWSPRHKCTTAKRSSEDSKRPQVYRYMAYSPEESHDPTHTSPSSPPAPSSHGDMDVDEEIEVNTVAQN